MNIIAEQIVKGLMHHGIRVAVNADGDLSLRGRTASLTEEERLDLRKHKPEIVHYLSEQPITPVVMYVAPDLEYWTTDEPHCWADKVTIMGKQFVRLTPSAVAWFKERVAKAEAACAVGKLPLDAFGRIVSAFCPIYDFAVRSGLVAPSPALARALAVQGAQ
jgi:hypothetical protein